jgi:hypothetical protein
METLERIRKTDLARQTREVIRNVQRGQTALIESHGQPEAALIDIIDYQIMRAVIRYHLHPERVDRTVALEPAKLGSLPSTQDRYDQVFAYYLAGGIDLLQAADLLDLSWLDLRTRCLRLDVPLQTVPAVPPEPLQNIQQVLEALAQSGVLTPPLGYSSLIRRSDAEREESARQLAKAAPKPVSEMIIEDRGPW